MSEEQWRSPLPKIKNGLLFPGVLWTVYRVGREWEGGRRRGAFQGLEPEFLLSGTTFFSKADLKQLYKRGLLSRF